MKKDAIEKYLEEPSGTPELQRILMSFQNGLMTYYHLYDTVNNNDRFNIGWMIHEIGIWLEESLKDYPEALELCKEMEESLFDLDSYDHESIDYQTVFADAFNSIGRIRAITGFTETY